MKPGRRKFRARFLEEYHALYFPKLRWWQKPETDEEDSGPRPKQLPPDHPRHSDPDNRGYRCGCSHGIPNCPDCPPCPGNPDWAVWLNLTGRGCVAPWTQVWLPMEGHSERIDRLAKAGEPVTVLSLTDEGPQSMRTDGAPFRKGMDYLYAVTAAGARPIAVTDQHRFLTPDGWQRFADLGFGSKIAAGARFPLTTRRS